MDLKAQLSSDDARIASLTTIVVAYINRNEISPSDLPPLIERIHRVLCYGHDDPSLDQAQRKAEEVRHNECSKGTVHDEYLVCLEDGRRFKSLKRHLKAQYDLTPDEYRRKWGLAPDYPMVAPAYSQARSSIARNLGLGVTISRRNGKMRKNDE
jgi:predicted transcriptional regulator